MVDKTKRENNSQNTTHIENGQPFMMPFVNEKKVLVFCDVCGHANPEEAALCQMCSNYLRR